MDKPISVGDLVTVVRWPCCNGDLGYTFRVAAVETLGAQGWCSHCGDQSGCHQGMPLKAVDHNGCIYPMPWLKRIPPLDELDDVKHDEEITA